MFPSCVGLITVGARRSRKKSQDNHEKESKESSRTQKSDGPRVHVVIPGEIIGEPDSPIADADESGLYRVAAENEIQSIVDSLPVVPEQGRFHIDTMRKPEFSKIYKVVRVEDKFGWKRKVVATL